MTRIVSKLAGLISIVLFSTLLNFAQAAETPLPTCETTLTDTVSGDEPVGKKDVFTKDTDMIYLVCKSDNVEKGQNIKAVWIAEDTNNAAPANYKIDEKGLDVTEALGENQVWTAKYSLSKPNAGWPLGSYRVDLFVGDKLMKSVKFTIK